MNRTENPLEIAPGIFWVGSAKNNGGWLQIPTC